MRHHILCAILHPKPQCYNHIFPAESLCNLERDSPEVGSQRTLMKLRVLLHDATSAAARSNATMSSAWRSDAMSRLPHGTAPFQNCIKAYEACMISSASKPLQPLTYEYGGFHWKTSNEYV